jgi:transposase, IS5 family
LALIAPHYPQAGNGRQPLGVEKMLRIYFLQQWFNLSDPQAEDAIYDSEAMRRFVRVELGDEGPGREYHPAFSPPARAAPADRDDLRCSAGAAGRAPAAVACGTIVDATIIAAPSSTKNASATPR